MSHPANDDLIRKLQDDLRRVLLHYCAMADIAGVDNDEQIATVCATLASCLGHLSHTNGLRRKDVVKGVAQAFRDAREA